MSLSNLKQERKDDQNVVKRQCYLRTAKDRHPGSKGEKGNR